MKFSHTTATVIIPAAGIGRRFGSAIPKQYAEVSGVPIIVRTLQTVLSLPYAQTIIVAISPTDTMLSEILAPFHLPLNRIHILHGGAERVDTVRNAMTHPSATQTDVVIVHDCVRPVASVQLFDRILRATLDFGVAVPGIAVTDTIKSIDDQGAVVHSLSRDSLRAIQTPQGFRKDVVHQILSAPTEGATDEAMLAERCGLPVHVVEGETSNIKVTSTVDVQFLETLVNLHSADIP